MAGIEHLEAKLAQIEELIEQLQAEKRDANSTLKLLQKERRETERYLRTTGHEMMEEALTQMIKRELDIMGPAMRAHTNSIYDKINDEVDKLINLSLGEPFSRKENRVDLRPMLAEKLKIWVLDIIRQEGLPIE